MLVGSGSIGCWPVVTEYVIGKSRRWYSWNMSVAGVPGVWVHTVSRSQTDRNPLLLIAPHRTGSNGFPGRLLQQRVRIVTSNSMRLQAEPDRINTAMAIRGSNPDWQSRPLMIPDWTICSCYPGRYRAALFIMVMKRLLCWIYSSGSAFIWGWQTASMIVQAGKDQATHDCPSIICRRALISSVFPVCSRNIRYSAGLAYFGRSGYAQE